jgi:hypothetical protein
LAWGLVAAGAVAPVRAGADQDGPSSVPAAVWLDAGLDAAERVTTTVGAPKRFVRLRLHGGSTVEGEVTHDLPEGLVLRLPSGELRLFTTDRIAVREEVARDRPTLLPRATLLLSLLWPGAGQVAYGAMVEKGPPWNRSALAPGVALAALGLAGWVGALGGVLVALSGKERTARGIVNPLVVAGLGVVVVAWGLGLLDAGTRAAGWPGQPEGG